MFRATNLLRITSSVDECFFAVSGERAKLNDVGGQIKQYINRYNKRTRAPLRRRRPLRGRLTPPTTLAHTRKNTAKREELRKMCNILRQLAPRIQEDKNERVTRTFLSVSALICYKKTARPFGGEELRLRLVVLGCTTATGLWLRIFYALVHVLRKMPSVKGCKCGLLASLLTVTAAVQRAPTLEKFGCRQFRLILFSRW